MNSVVDLQQLSGTPDPDDVLLIIDVDAGTPVRDRSWLVESARTVFDRPAFIDAGAPTAADDETIGVLVGNRWLDTSGPTLYMCTDATEGAAVWRTIADWS